MALSSTIAPQISIPLSCAKTLISNTLRRRTPPSNPRHHPPSATPSILHTKPIFRISSRASTPHPTPRKYAYPDPSSEFAQSETQKFRIELLKKLSKDRETFGDDIDEVVDFCSKIFSDFLYGGPGTLLVEPFTDMMVALKERKLPGAPLAARAALLWAPNYVDQDWEIRNPNLPS